MEEQANLVVVGGELQKACVSLRVIGDDLDPAEITALLGCTPTRGVKKGDIKPHPRHHLEERTGGWDLESDLAESVPLGEQIDHILSRVTQDLTVWNQLATRFRMDLFCGLFLDTCNRGLELSPETLRKVSERHLTLGLDIYSGDSEDTDDKAATA